MKITVKILLERYVERGGLLLRRGRGACIQITSCLPRYEKIEILHNK